MLKSKVFFLLLMISLVVISCTSNQNKPTSTSEKIGQLEALLFSENSKYNEQDATQLLQLYVRYADSVPNDSLAPEYLFKAADISIYQTDNQRTIDLLDRIITAYPTHDKAATSLFLKAFVYDTKVGDTAAAHQYYEAFIQEHPDNVFVEDARSAIRNLGKSLDELIKEFEKMNQ